MRDAENIREVEALHPDWMGFIFWPKSRRYVSSRPAYLPTKCKRVGVFVDEDIEQVRRIADDYALDIIQLHGSESPEQIAHLSSLTSLIKVKATSSITHLSIIKAFNIATEDDLKATKAYEGIADYFLFDTTGKSVGGNGEKFDWSVLDTYEGSTPFLLSGGIGPDDAECVKDFLISRPSPLTSKCIGIDLNSRFETAPALKDINKLREFIKEIRL